MHNLKEIRNDFESFKKKLKNRNIKIDIDIIRKLDEKNRKLIQNKEKLESEKKKSRNLKMKSYLISLKKYQKN